MRKLPIELLPENDVDIIFDYTTRLTDESGEYKDIRIKKVALDHTKHKEIIIDSKIIAQIEGYATYNMSLHDIAILLDIDPVILKKLYNDKKCKIIKKAYDKGLAGLKLSLNKGVISNSGLTKDKQENINILMKLWDSKCNTQIGDKEDNKNIENKNFNALHYFNEINSYSIPESIKKINENKEIIKTIKLDERAESIKEKQKKIDDLSND